MDEGFLYPVYFECPDLLPAHERTVERYFRNRRKSGGGDGGPLRKDHTGGYSIWFKHQKDQHEVLRRKNHTVQIGNSSLMFSVREAQASPSSTPETSADQEPPQADRSNCETTTKTYTGSSLPPSGENYELQVDRYLLHYLKDCPKAEKWLRKQLELLYCTADLYPEDERVVVRRCGSTSGNTSDDNWKTDISVLFETVKNHYTCHFETDPHKVQYLLKSSNSQTADDVKVYSEIGLAVVVGEVSQVDTLLNSLQEDRSFRTKRIVWPLGEAKLRLLWNRIENSLEKELPNIEVSQEEGGKLVAKGNATALLQVDEVITDLDQKVIERTLSNFSPCFLSFWKKAFGKPGTCYDSTRLGVEIEIRETDLRLLSFCPRSLDEMELVLQTQFKMEEIPIANMSVYTLREEIRPIYRRMNSDAFRVTVLESVNVIYLVGHTEEVKELHEHIIQMIDNLQKENEPQELPGKSPRLSHSIDLNEISPPVQEVDSVKVNERVSTLCLDKDAKVVARYFLNEELEVIVCLGDITKQEADVLVNAANEDLKHSGGVALALSKAGGPEVQSESSALVESYGKIRTGEAVVTSGGELKCKKLIHAVGPMSGKGGGSEKALIQKAITSALGLCEIMDFSSIVLPCISSGSSGVPVELCTEAIASAVRAFGAVEGRSLKTIVLIDNRNKVVQSLEAACNRLLQGMPPGGDSPVTEATVSLETAAAPKGDSRGSVTVDIIQGTIETQQVDAVVSPMSGGGPRSTRVGNCLYEAAGSQLTDSYSKQDGGEMPGDSVLVEGLEGAMFNAVFFVHLLQWDNDLDGTAVQVMRLAVGNVLTSCENQGFTSVAFPPLGAGMILGFPENVVAQVLLEEIYYFIQQRSSKTPFTINIVCPPSDLESELEKTFNMIQESLERPVHQDSESKRIILLGKTGSGKSSVGNTILGEDFFKTDDTPNSGTKECQSKTKLVNGKNITLIDTPGLFDSECPEEELMPEILSCLTESSPGPHAFLIVLKVEKFTAQEQAIIMKICQYFSEEALQYATVVFTHGNQLTPGMTIETFIKQNQGLSELVKKCGDRCHVVDNTYWNDHQSDQYRSNKFQVEALLETIEEMVKSNNWGCYTNKVSKTLEKDIEKEMEVISKESNTFITPEALRKEAKQRVSNRWLISLAGVGTGALLGAIFGVEALVRLVMTAVRKAEVVKGAQKLKSMAGLSIAASDMLAVGGVVTALAGVTGGIYGGVIGGRASDEANSVEEAYERSWKAVMRTREDTLKALELKKTQ